METWEIAAGAAILIVGGVVAYELATGNLQNAVAGSASGTSGTAPGPGSSSTVTTNVTANSTNLPSGYGTVTDVNGVSVIDLSSVQQLGGLTNSTAALNTQTGLITLTNTAGTVTTLNEYTTNQGVQSSTNAASVAGQAGTVGSNVVGLNSNTPVYGYGTAYSGPGEYTSTSGAPEYISSQAQYNSQAALGFLSSPT